MKKDNLLKALMLVTAIALALCVLVAYFAWAYSQAKQEYLDTQIELSASSEQLYELNKSLELSAEELAMANTTIVDLKGAEYELVYLGEFKFTHYCVELKDHICGTGDGITSSGTQIIAGKSVAIDPEIIPYGSQLYIEGYGFCTAEDSGGAVQGSHIDIAVETHEEALDMGITSGGVWILIKKP